MASTRGILTRCPPLVNMPSLRAQRSMFTTLALAFQISSRYAISAWGSFPSVIRISLSSFSPWMLWMPKMSLNLVSSVKRCRKDLSAKASQTTSARWLLAVPGGPSKKTCALAVSPKSTAFMACSISTKLELR